MYVRFEVFTRTEVLLNHIFYKFYRQDIIISIILKLSEISFFSIAEVLIYFYFIFKSNFSKQSFLNFFFDV